MNAPTGGRPEDRARANIDRLLTAAGWIIQNRDSIDMEAGRGIAIREFPLSPGHGFADYLLYVDGYAAGVVEAKKAGVPSSASKSRPPNTASACVPKPVSRPLSTISTLQCLQSRIWPARSTAHLTVPPAFAKPSSRKPSKANSSPKTPTTSPPPFCSNASLARAQSAGAGVS